MCTWRENCPTPRPVTCQTTSCRKGTQCKVRHGDQEVAGTLRGCLLDGSRRAHDRKCLIIPLSHGRDGFWAHLSSITAPMLKLSACIEGPKSCFLHLFPSFFKTGSRHTPPHTTAFRTPHSVHTAYNSTVSTSHTVHSTERIPHTHLTCTSVLSRADTV